MTKIISKIFPVMLTMVVTTMMLVGMEMYIPFQSTFSLIKEQDKLGTDKDGQTKSYSDCKGFAEMMERAGVPEDQIGLNYDWVQARMLAMPNLISATSNETEKEKLQEEFDCLLAVNAINTNQGPMAGVCETLRQGPTGVKCLFDGLSGAEPIPSSSLSSSSSSVVSNCSELLSLGYILDNRDELN